MKSPSESNLLVFYFLFDEFFAPSFFFGSGPPLESTPFFGSEGGVPFLSFAD